MKTLFYRIMRFFGSIIFKILFFPKVSGKENIVGGRVIFAGNHTKWLDPLLLISSNRRILHFLAKIELFQGILKPFIVGMLCIPVNRKVHDGKALIEAKKVLEKDEAICIFPEGTINRTDDTIMPFKTGAVRMAYSTNSKIIPFTIKGKFRLFGIGGRVTLTYLEPITVTKDIEKSNKKLEKIIKNNLEEV